MPVLSKQALALPAPPAPFQRTDIYGNVIRRPSARQLLLQAEERAAATSRARVARPRPVAPAARSPVAAKKPFLPSRSVPRSGDIYSELAGTSPIWPRLAGLAVIPGLATYAAQKGLDYIHPALSITNHVAGGLNAPMQVRELMRGGVPLVDAIRQVTRNERSLLLKRRTGGPQISADAPFKSLLSEKEIGRQAERNRRAGGAFLRDSDAKVKADQGGASGAATRNWLDLPILDRLRSLQYEDTSNTGVEDVPKQEGSGIDMSKYMNYSTGGGALGGLVGLALGNKKMSLLRRLGLVAAGAGLGTLTGNYIDKR